MLRKTIKRTFKNFEKEINSEQLAYLKLALLNFKSQKQELQIDDRIQKLALTELKAYNKLNPIQLNKFQMDVFNFLKRNVDYVKRGAMRENDQVQIQISVQNREKKRKKVAILALSNDNYILNQQQQLMGCQTSFINILEYFGWKVVVVREKDWGDKSGLFSEQLLNNVLLLLQ
eukprot:TRINITY_DN3903_c0_g2_i5.p2 TRINITY_DN3903_c0_g2~~TRINITY_DN3903_c0_g2_i5.p2  ORF type:complete len:174 (+),score=14.54 TRINITY_DN3903_c0_g2_i5:247-768(+)